MRYNKSLGIAIATILTGGIGMAANAGEFTILFPDDTKVAQEVASESVKDNGSNIGTLPAAVGIVDNVTTWFEFQRNSSITFNVYIDYTLSGATFGKDLETPEFVDTYNTANTTAAAITLIKGGKEGETTVRYLLQTSTYDLKTNIKTGDWASRDEDRLVLKLRVKEVEGLASNSGTVKLKAEWGEAKVGYVSVDSASVSLFESTTGVKVTIAGTETPAKIDVTKGNKKFEGGVNGLDTAISLGTVSIAEIGSLYDISTTSIDGGNLVVVGGPFSASTGENQVFLDINTSVGPCVFTEDEDAVATIDDDEATFELSSQNIVDISKVTSGVAVCVLVADDNETNINDTKDKATASLTIDYSSDKSETYVNGLDRTKRNGTSCSLYNVPHKQASDRGWYRFFNKTDVEVTVWGSVRDRDGKEHLVDQELGIAPANGTLVVNSDQLHDYAITETGAAAENPWAGRAILTINSNSTDMEAYGSLRAKNTSSVLVPAGVAQPPVNIGPLINISAGATGNGCE